MLDAVYGSSVQSLDIQFVTSVNSLSITEGEDAYFEVKLSARPPEKFTAKVAITSGDEVFELITRTLRFDFRNWNIAQKIFVKALRDDDSQNQQGVVTISASNIAPITVSLIQMDRTAPPRPARVIIDPVTRIEGHLKIETSVDGGKVSDAWSSATLFRGIEMILKGRDPLDAPLITQRVCGVCTYIHMLTSSRCLEDAYDVAVPANARILRNLLLGAQFVHDHIVHFYHLHAMDWVDIVSALSADPNETENLATTISSLADPIDFSSVQNRLKGFVETGQLGPFKNAYWGHEAYSLSAEENLLLAAHYLTALKKQADIARLHAIFGGKNPHPHGVVVGGVTCAGELSQQSRIDEFGNILASARHFVDTVYMPDVKLLARGYSSWASMGTCDHLLSFGEFPTGPNEPMDLFLPQGVILNRSLSDIHPVDLDAIREHATHSWYQNPGANHPYDGETAPAYTGYNTADCYSWLKAPRYMEYPMEVGPLARVMVAYGMGHGETVRTVDDFLSGSRLSVEQMFSTLGRTAARAIETKVIAQAMVDWLDELQANLISGDDQVYERYQKASQCRGMGINEAPRGALGHWATIDNGKVSNYQMVVPSTWNFGPRCQQDIPGPVEHALVGTPVADPSKPLEILRVIHSFDPCIACGVHVLDKRADRVFNVSVR
jgi:[NiFe] hydrogenase large subunit